MAGGAKLLGVILDADNPTLGIIAFYSLYDVVLGSAHDPEGLSNPTDRLVVKTVHLQIGGSIKTSQYRVGLEPQFVGFDVEWFALPVRYHSRFEILDEATAKRDVENLTTPAYSEYRQFAPPGLLDHLDLERIEGLVDGGRRVDGLVEQRGVWVYAAW